MAQHVVKPNRMELLNVKKRIVLATKGHKLLKDKRDALFNEFFSVLGKSQALRKQAERELEQAQGQLAVSEALLGSVKVTEFSLAASSNQKMGVSIGQRNIMGVKVPQLTATNVMRKVNERGYSLVESNATIDDAARQFEQALEKLVQLAEMESALMNLAFEIEKTKRKVNALEYVLIPGLQQTKRYIAFRLEEMERDKFVTLKKIKKKLDARHAQP